MFYQTSITICLIIMLCLYAFGNETDNFSYRNKSLKDSSEVINKYVNGYLKLSIDGANKVKNGCNLEKLMEMLKYELNTNFPEIYDDLNRSEDVDKVTPSGAEADVYSDAGAWGCCAPNINVNGHRVGLDKIDHIFSHGLPYYLIVTETKDIQKALDFGIRQENSYWGLMTTRVKSYGDLAANYKGYLFWSQVLEGENPYIICKNNSFILNRQFDIRDYVDDSMDEAINCSSFTSRTNKDYPKSMAAVVLKFINELGYERCPVEPEKCDKLVAKIPKEIAGKILHPACRNTKKSNLSFEETPEENDRIGFKEAAQMATEGVKIKNLLKGLGILGAK